ncbi:Crp/Fnr family transcriptional regulator [Sphingomonas sp. 3-13AW]|uniref:Crp/Fnr family transcriptional regulator n=1 Tax=Sphingomonas sp. 3-13AW TaxID=3050450 RepID=UPI003BB4AC68
MKQSAKVAVSVDHARVRLASIARIAPEGLQMLDEAAMRARVVAPHRDIVYEGERIQQPLLMLSGWACRTRTLMDGRRQVLSLVLPGDLLGYSAHHQQTALASVTAITGSVVCPAPTFAAGDDCLGLVAAYAASNVLDESYLLAQITRLGRMNALERISDWMLEIHERLCLADIISGNSFQLPVTQELMADALGLTSVHVNRTLQAMRREGLLDLRGGTATLLDPSRMRAMVGAVSSTRRALPVER